MDVPSSQWTSQLVILASVRQDLGYPFSILHILSETLTSEILRTLHLKRVPRYDRKRADIVLSPVVSIACFLSGEPKSKPTGHRWHATSRHIRGSLRINAFMSWRFGRIYDH